MTPNDLELRKKWRLELEKLGPEQVRIALQNQTHMANVERAYAWEWLRETAYADAIHQSENPIR